MPYPQLQLTREPLWPTPSPHQWLPCKCKRKRPKYGPGQKEEIKISDDEWITHLSAVLDTCDCADTDKDNVLLELVKLFASLYTFSERGVSYNLSSEQQEFLVALMCKRPKDSVAFLNGRM